MPQLITKTFQQRINEKLGEIHGKAVSDLTTIKKVSGLSHLESGAKILNVGGASTQNTSMNRNESNLNLK